MLKYVKNLMFSVTFIAFGAAPLQAMPAACSNLAGTTIFADLLYGVAGGSIISGLYMAAEDNFNRTNSKLAYGALAGSAIGVGVGLAEVFSAKCQPVSEGKSTASTSTGTNFRLFAAPASGSSSSVMGINVSLAI